MVRHEMPFFDPHRLSDPIRFFAPDHFSAPDRFSVPGRLVFPVCGYCRKTAFDQFLIVSPQCLAA